MLNCLTTNSLVSMSQFIEMFGDPIKNSKNLPSLKGEELFVFSSGKANTKANLSKEFPYDCYGGNGITGKSEQWLIDFPTIIVGRVGEYCGCVHKTQGKIWITDNAIFIKEYKEKVFNGEFLFYLMTYLDFHRLADETGQPKITQRPLLSTEYMVPNLSLQEQFVSIAHQADKSGFVSIKSQFIEMFGDISINSKQWPVDKLGNLSEIKIGPFGSLIHQYDYEEGGHYLINPSQIINNKIISDPKIAVSNKRFEDLQAYALSKGDIVLGRRGEMGRAGIVKTEGMLCGTGSMIIRPKEKEDSLFLHLFIISPHSKKWLENNSVGTTMMNLNTQIVSNMIVPILPKKLKKHLD